ncbi:MAG: DUF1349 domain-containing protein, partial [Firmicutes bacterium]|nr:DUF1349 domain-containing protein [Bacillota bacterium]
LDPLVPGGYLFGWITGYDGTPTHGPEVGHEQGWVSLFSGSNVANAYLAQVEYTGGDIADALDILLGQARTLMSFFEFNGAKDIYEHKGVWAGGNTYSPGAFSESMAAVYSIETLIKYREKYPTAFTGPESAEIDAWALMLPKIPPYGDKITTAYDPQKGGYILLHSTAGMQEMVVGDTGIVGGPTNKPYLWYNTLPFDHYSIKPTMLAVAESGQFDYNFNTGWSAAVMARAGEASFASQYTRFMLRPTSLYDDFYFCENKNDGEDYKRSPALGGHGAFVMALSAQLFDGDNEEYIRMFPAIDSVYQKQGASFERFLARGSIEVSGSFKNSETTVKLKNLSASAMTRDVYVRVAEGSGAAMYNGAEYPIIDGCFIKIPAVTIAAGATVEMTVQGKAKDIQVTAFKAQFPAPNARGIRTENVAFGWERSETAASYQLVISKNANLSQPIFDKNVGSSTFYYPLNISNRINLEEGTTYYWTVYGINGDNSRMMTEGIVKFTTLSSSFEVFGKTFETKGGIDVIDGSLLISIGSGANDTSNTALITPTSKNFTVTTQIRYRPTIDHQQAGILLYVNDNDYLKFSRAFTASAKCFEFKTAEGAQAAKVADNVASETVYLRLQFSNTAAIALYSADGNTWVTVGTFVTNSFYNKSFKVGLFGSVWTAGGGGTAEFLSFDITYQ